MGRAAVRRPSRTFGCALNGRRNDSAQRATARRRPRPLLRRTGRLLFLEVRKPWGGYKACARFVSPRPLNRTASACGRCIQTLSNPVVVVALAVGVVEAEKRSQCLGFDCIGQASADQEGATNGIHGAE